MSEHPADRLQRELLRVLALVLAPFPILLVVGFYFKYQTIGNTIIVGTLIAVSAYLYLKHTHIKPKKQQALIDPLNSILKKYGLPLIPPVTQAIPDKDLEDLIRNKEDEIVVSAGTQLVDKYSDVLCRKRRQMVYQDDYDREVRKDWNKELAYFTKTVFLPELASELSTSFASSKVSDLLWLYDDDNEAENIKFWSDFTDSYISAYVELDKKFAQGALKFDELMSGHEYEHYVAEIIREYGWQARVTSGSGDHGADIIAEKNGIRVAVQCKLYSSPVGNKSVQEAFSAQGFYDCHKSCVVTNNTFTNAARKAAYKLNVSLLHHDKLCDFLAELA